MQVGDDARIRWKRVTGEIAVTEGRVLDTMLRGGRDFWIVQEGEDGNPAPLPVPKDAILEVEVLVG